MSCDIEASGPDVILVAIGAFPESNEDVFRSKSASIVVISFHTKKNVHGKIRIALFSRMNSSS